MNKWVRVGIYHGRTEIRVIGERDTGNRRRERKMRGGDISGKRIKSKTWRDIERYESETDRKRERETRTVFELSSSNIPRIFVCFELRKSLD